MRVRLSPKGAIIHNVKDIFSYVSDENFFEATIVLKTLRADIIQYYVSRDMDMETITDQLNGLQITFNARSTNMLLKQTVIYEGLQKIIATLNNGDEKNKPVDKYERLMQIYEDIQDDIEQFGRTRKYEDAESIRGDFSDIRELENKFRSDDAEYTIYQELVRQIGLCNGTMMRASFETVDDSDMKKMYNTFENLFPKIESLLASKEFREVTKKKEENLSESRIKEINDLVEQQNMNAEEIAKHTGLSKDAVESVMFGEDDRDEH